MTGGTGRLLGIARHAAVRAPMETVDSAEVTIERGIEGDHRGIVRPDGNGRRQVTLIDRRAWDAALAEIDRDIPWFERRVNLLVDRLDLPRTPGVRLRIGDVVLEVTRECDPCSRMDAVAPGLQAALTPDWRGGICTRVRNGGRIAVGNEIGFEEP